MNRAVIALTLLCGLALTVPASAAPMRTQTAKVHTTTMHVKKTGTLQVAHKKHTAKHPVRHAKVLHRTAIKVQKVRAMMHPAKHK